MDNFDLKKYLGNKTLLNENAPGYDTRKSGEALPTLESVRTAYEAKNKIKEDSFSSGDDPNIDLYTHDVPSDDPFTLELKLIEFIRDNGIDPMEALETIGQEFGISFEYGR